MEFDDIDRTVLVTSAPPFGFKTRRTFDRTGALARGELALLRCVIEHVDYGLALIHIATRKLRLANQPALIAMGGESGHSSGLCVLDGQVQALHQQDERTFERSITLAR